MSVTVSYNDGWKLLGNAGTNPTINFVGTTDNQNLVVKTNNQSTAIFVSDSGDFTPSLIVGNDTNLAFYQTNTSAKSFIDSTSSGYVALNQNNQVFTVRNGSGALGFRLNRANGTYDAPTGILNGWQLGDLSWNTYTGLPASPTTSVRSARIVVTANGNHITNTNAAAKFAIELTRSGWGNATESLRLLGDNAGIGFNNTPVTTWEVGKYTAANALPAATGTAQSAGHIQRLTSNGNNTTLDLGTDATQSWIQSVDKTNLASQRTLHINPNGGNVIMGGTSGTAWAQLDVRGSGIFLPTSSGTTGLQFGTSTSGLLLGRIYQDQTNATLSRRGMTFRSLNNNHHFSFVTSAGAYAMHINSTTGYVGVNNENPAATLDVASTTKGVLIPRMTTAQRNAIVTPALSELLYNTDTMQFEFWDGVKWTGLAGTFNGALTYAETQISLAGTATDLTLAANINTVIFTDTPNAGALTVDGIQNIGVNNQITFINKKASNVTFRPGQGAIGNQISGTGNIVVGANESVTFRYSLLSGQWNAVARF